MSTSPSDLEDPEDVEVDGGEDAPTPVLAAVRQRHPSSGRSRTIPASRPLSRQEQYQRYDDVLRDGGAKQAAFEAERPKTRGDCGYARPCPWVNCSQHLYLDVDERTGALKLNFPDLEVWQMAYSCALDEAEASGGEGMTLEQVAERTNLTRERIRQLEERVKRELRPAARAIEEGDPIPPRHRLRVIRGA